jgi:hypothetical protein
VIFFPATFARDVLQERIASPFARTVHDPHNPCPQPNFVPVNASSSRNTHKRGVSGGEETDCGFPLMVSSVGIRASGASGRLPVAGYREPDTGHRFFAKFYRANRTGSPISCNKL